MCTPTSIWGAQEVTVVDLGPALGCTQPLYNPPAGQSLNNCVFVLLLKISTYSSTYLCSLHASLKMRATYTHSLSAVRHPVALLTRVHTAAAQVGEATGRRLWGFVVVDTCL